MRVSNRASCPAIAAALTLVAAVPALAQSLPGYGGATVTQCIPFANFQPVSFTDPPKLSFSTEPPPPAPKKAPFINTGRHFLRQSQFLYDAKQGYVGMKDQPNPCGEQ